MKLQFYPLTIILAFLFNSSFAQEETKLTVVNKAFFPASISAIENSESISVAFIDKVQARKFARTDSVSQKVLRAFTSSFKDAAAERWFASGNKNKSYLVTFTKNERKYTAVYRKDGYLEYAVGEGCEKDLSSQLKKIVAQEYFEYTIISVTELITENGTSWSISLQNGNEVVFIRMSEGALEELARVIVESKNNDVAKKD